MGINRLTSGYLNNQAVNYLNKNLSLISQLQQKLSSGQNINSPSDDPVGLVRVLDLSNTLRTDDRYSKNIQSGIAEANTTDSVMDSMVNLIQRAQELTTQAATFTSGQDGRAAISLEINQIIDQMVQLGNTDIGGKYIFGGLKTDTPPFSRTGDNISYTGSPASGDWQQKIEISRGVQLSLNTNGYDLLGSTNVTTASPPLPATFSADSQGIFKTLVSLKQSLDAGGDANQLSEIKARLDELTTGMNGVLGKQAIVGAISNRLELSQGRIDERKSILTQQYASIQDIDTPSVVANLNNQQNTLEASLSVTAKVLQTNLLDYVR